MADLMKDANALRFYYTSDDAMKDKDSLKNEAYLKSSRVASGYMLVPMSLQLLQIQLANHESKAAFYSKTRMFKMVTFAAALGGMTYELVQLRKKMTYYDRFYPEATELQKTLYREAQMFKEKRFTPESIEAKMAKAEDPELQQIYASMYRLAPQNNSEPEEGVNADGGVIKR